MYAMLFAVKTNSALIKQKINCMRFYLNSCQACLYYQLLTNR